MPPKTGDPGDKTMSENRLTTRQETKRLGRTLIAEDNEEIKDIRKGRRYLEEKQLLWPPGEPITLSAIVACLHQTSALANVPKPVINVIRSIAYILEEVEKTAMQEALKDAIDSQMNELHKNFATLVSEATERVDAHLNTKLDEMTTGMETLNNLIQKAEETRQPTTRSNTEEDTNSRRTARSHAEVIAASTKGINPRLAAKEGIKARQFMLEGVINNAKLSHLTDNQIKDELNRTITQQGFEGKCIRSATKQRLGGILLEMHNENAAEWVRSPENRDALCATLGPGPKFRGRTYQMIALNVSLLLDPTNKEHLKEITEVNHLEDDTISAVRWAKPIVRRSPGQRSAHLILTFTDINEANRAVVNGLTICNKKAKVEKVKKEPTRCLKCQGWNHFAKECLEDHDTCGNCAEHHRTNLCPTPTKKVCTSCKTDTHASWSRTCPVFLRKTEECNRCFPENALTFIPSSDPWTWLENNENRQNRRETRVTQEKLIDRNLRQYDRNEHDQPDPMDDYYIPNNPYLPDWNSDDPPNPRQNQQEEPNRPPTRPTAADYI